MKKTRLLKLILFTLTISILSYAYILIPPNTYAATCTISSTLVNSCRPWFGAVVAGDAHAASDPVSQFNYFESILGRQIDVFHDYHPSSNLPLNSNEIHFAQRANTYIYVNWKPASDWVSAGGGNSTINTKIDQAATNIKAIAPTKVFLTIWHEPENDVSAYDDIAEQTACQNDPNFKGLKGTAGTPAQYIAMWQNVENRFAADGVTNVVWVMNYMGYQAWDCLVPHMWPGNNLIDWITYDAYSSSDATTWDNTIGRFYNVLTADSNSTNNFLSKTWGLGEFGDCTTTDQAHIYQYYQQAKTALDNNAYPKLKMYMVYDSNGNNAGLGCLTDYDINGTYDPTEQIYFNEFANDPIFLKTSTSTDTSSQAASSGNSSTGSGGTDPNFPVGYTSVIMAGPHYQGNNTLQFILGDTGAQTFIPTGAIHDDATIAVSRVLPPTLLQPLQTTPFPWMQGINTAGDIYKFQMIAAFNGMLIQKFDYPVIIVLPYDPQRLYGINPNQLKIVTYNINSKQWEFLTSPMVVDWQHHTIATTVSSYSYFTVGYLKR